MVLSFASSALVPGATGMGFFAPVEQPIRRSFGVTQLVEDGHPIEIRTRDAARWPFCVMAEFCAPRAVKDRVLLVSPLSGHFSFILRELVVGLSGHMSVSVTDWLNARFVPLSAGDFGFDENIETILRCVRLLGPGAHVVALCQGVVPALAATAIMSQDESDYAPRSLTLIGGPVDPLANPTRIVKLLRQRSLHSIEASALDRVGSPYPGAGRHVYPARFQLSALLAYLYRHWVSGGELQQKVLNDDGLDPVHFPFLDLFTSLMDLPAKYFLENIQKVFLERQPWTGQLKWRGEPIDFRTIGDTALMTIEGADDDIAAPGQTSAAHRLCSGIPDRMRHRLIVGDAGHFSLFYGKICREKVLPEIRQFIKRANDAASASLLYNRQMISCARA